MALSRLWKSLAHSASETDERARDPRLRGRTYQVPYARVWDEILHMISTLPRWDLLQADESSGLIRAESTNRLFGFANAVAVKVKLDRNALTRVDVRSASPLGRIVVGNNARLISWFLNALDRRLGLDQR